MQLAGIRAPPRWPRDRRVDDHVQLEGRRRKPSGSIGSPGRTLQPARRDERGRLVPAPGVDREVDAPAGTDVGGRGRRGGRRGSVVVGEPPGAACRSCWPCTKRWLLAGAIPGSAQLDLLSSPGPGGRRVRATATRRSGDRFDVEGAGHVQLEQCRRVVHLALRLRQPVIWIKKDWVDRARARPPGRSPRPSTGPAAPVEDASPTVMAFELAGVPHHRGFWTNVMARGVDRADA